MRAKTKEQALKEANQLVEWCKVHHKSTPVCKYFSKRYCNDPKRQKGMWCILQYLKEAAADRRGGWFPEAFKVLDDAFGPAWRQKSMGEIWRGGR